MDWLLTGNPLVVNRLVLASLSWLAAAAVCYALYHAFLRSRVEYGEMHPGNLRRSLWACFFVMITLACMYFFKDSLRFPAAWILLLPAVLAPIVVFATRLRV